MFRKTSSRDGLQLDAVDAQSLSPALNMAHHKKMIIFPIQIPKLIAWFFFNSLWPLCPTLAVNWDCGLGSLY